MVPISPPKTPWRRSYKRFYASRFLNTEISSQCYTFYQPKRDNWYTYWFPESKPSIFSFDRVCDSWSIENVIENLPQTPLKNFLIDPNQRAEYVRKFIGFDDFDSCNRILDILENDPL